MISLLVALWLITVTYKQELGVRLIEKIAPTAYCDCQKVYHAGHVFLAPSFSNVGVARNTTRLSNTNVLSLHTLEHFRQFLIAVYCSFCQTYKKDLWMHFRRCIDHTCC